MIVDRDIQLLPMSMHTQADAPIGGVPPLIYGMQIVPGKHRSLLLWTAGNSQPKAKEPYPAWMLYPSKPRPILPNTGKLRVSMKYALGGNLAGCNTVETDVLIVQNGLMFNRSFQHVQTKGYQIADVDGNWVTVASNPAPLVADCEYAVAFDNVFDGNGSATTSIEQDGVKWKWVVPGVPMIPGKPTTWPTGVYAQVQLGSMPSAEPWSLKIQMDLEWQ